MAGMKNWQKNIYQAFRVQMLGKMWKMVKNVYQACQHRILVKLAIGRLSFWLIGQMANFGYEC